WGRAAAREDVAAAVERVVAMSGQFEQRRLARPSYQLEVLDRFCGEEQLAKRAESRVAWRELLAARRRHEELSVDAERAQARLAELRALAEDTEGMEPDDEVGVRAERERLRHVAELAEAAATAAAALAPDDGAGAAGLAALAARAGAPLARLAPRGSQRRGRGCRRSPRSCVRSETQRRPPSRTRSRPSCATSAWGKANSSARWANARRARRAPTRRSSSFGRTQDCPSHRSP